MSADIVHTAPELVQGQNPRSKQKAAYGRGLKPFPPMNPRAATVAVDRCITLFSENLGLGASGTEEFGDA